MAKRRKPKKGASARSGDYEVGYGKPPKEHQFKPGQSGNRAGRPREHRNFNTDLDEALARPMRVKDGNCTKTIPTQQAFILVLIQKAVRGDLRAIKILMEHIERRSQKADGSGAGEVVSADEEAILQAFEAEILAKAGLPPSGDPDKPGRPDGRVRRRKLRDE